MKPTKKLVAGAAAFATATAGVMALGVTSASAGSIDLFGTVQSEPVNDAGVAAYNNNFVGGAELGVADGHPGGRQRQPGHHAGRRPEGRLCGRGRGLDRVRVRHRRQRGHDHRAVGQSCKTSAALSAAVAISGNYSGIGPGKDIPTLNFTVTAPVVGLHTYDIRNMNTNGNGPSSGSGFGARTGFDANTNRSADPAETNPLANYADLAGADWQVDSTVDIDLRQLTVNSTSGQSVATYGRGAGSYEPGWPRPGPVRSLRRPDGDPRLRSCGCLERGHRDGPAL